MALGTDPLAVSPLDQPNASPCAGLVARLTEHRGRTWVDVLDTDGIESLCLPAAVDLEGARRLAGALRAVRSVRIDVCDARVWATVRGTGHRQPVERAIPLGIALGLARRGVPTLLVRSRGATAP